jgi:hypothetical protein
MVHQLVEQRGGHEHRRCFVGREGRGDLVERQPARGGDRNSPAVEQGAPQLEGRSVEGERRNL